MIIRIVSERKMTDKSDFKNWQEMLLASGMPKHLVVELETSGSTEWNTMRQGDELKRTYHLMPEMVKQ